MSRRWKIVPGTVAVVVAVLALQGCGAGRQGESQDDGQGDSAPVPVTVEPAVAQDVPVYLTNLGSVVALSTITVNPQVGGRLMSLDFTEGQPVRKGQVLARIDPRELQATYDQELATKKQNQALLATAQDSFERMNDPKYSQYVARTDLETQRNLVKQYTAAVAASDAQIEAARVQLQYTTITSPIDGIAGIRGVDVGNIVSTSSSLVTITQVEPINVSFSLPAVNLGAVRRATANGGKPEVAVVDSGDRGKVIAGDGVLEVVDNQVDTDTNTFKLRASFPNADHALWPGQSVNARLKVATEPGTVVVPSQAVQRGPDGDYVYVVQGDDTVKMQGVSTGVEVGDSHVAVSKGLKAGERVVTEGQFRLKPGSKVEPLAPGQTPAAPTDEELKKAGSKEQGGRHRGTH
ncbi:MAG: efflux RND transporter periplasmic adaptor subunit [Pseudoxanthomonas sp.]